MKKYEDAGITLIALIVTIIVLLILAGVSLSFIAGSDGIIGKAERANSQHEQLAEKEALELAYSGSFMNYELFNEEITADDFAKEIEENGKKAGVVEDEDDPNTMIVTFDKTNNIFYINMSTGKVEFVGTYDGTDNNIELQAGDIKFESTPTEWTTGTVATTISVNSEIDMTNFVLQYSKDGKKWTVYTSEIISEKNETIYARIKHSMTGQKKLEASTTIGNIDKLEPTGTLEVTAQTTNSITVKVTANDQVKTTDNACSGIKGYYYSSDNGITWTEITTDATYTFENLTQTTDYNLKVKIEDNAENTTEVGASGITGSVVGASSSNVSYTTKWSGTNAIVTFTTSSGFTVQTSKNGSVWSNTNPITVATGTQIYVRLSDGTNSGTSYSAVKPVLTYTVAYNGNGATSGSTASSSHTYGTAKALTANGFAKTGYTFLGWSKSSTATTATYTDKQSVTNLSSTNGATVNLYAVWGQISSLASLSRGSYIDFGQNILTAEQKEYFPGDWTIYKITNDYVYVILSDLIPQTDTVLDWLNSIDLAFEYPADSIYSWGIYYPNSSSSYTLNHMLMDSSKWNFIKPSSVPSDMIIYAKGGPTEADITSTSNYSSDTVWFTQLIKWHSLSEGTGGYHLATMADGYGRCTYYDGGGYVGYYYRIGDGGLRPIMCLNSSIQFIKYNNAEVWRYAP